MADWTGYRITNLVTLDADKLEAALASLREWVDSTPAPAMDQSSPGTDGPTGIRHHLVVADQLLAISPGRRDACFAALGNHVAFVREQVANPLKFVERTLAAMRGTPSLAALEAKLGRDNLAQKLAALNVGNNSMMGMTTWDWTDDGLDDPAVTPPTMSVS